MQRITRLLVAALASLFTATANAQYPDKPVGLPSVLRLQSDTAWVDTSQNSPEFRRRPAAGRPGRRHGCCPESLRDWFRARQAGFTFGLRSVTR